MSNPAPVHRMTLAVALRRTVATAAVGFVLIVAVLSIRMAIGEDPALAPKLADRPSATASSTPVIRIFGDDEEGDGEGAATVVPVAPTPPAPAPSPAPMQSTTS